MKARMYDPTVGRFYSTDPEVNGTDALSLNPYIYTGNNPINRIDPDGKGWINSLNNAWNKTKQVSKVAYNFIIGDDINTLRDPNASLFSKVIAGISIVTTVLTLVLPVLAPVLSLVTKGLKTTCAVAKVAKALLVTREFSGAAKLGKVGEIIGNADKEKTVITVVRNGISKTRIPDKYSETAIGEIKNVIKQADTSQLKDDLLHAKQTGRIMELITNNSTKLSAPLQAKVDAGLIVHTPMMMRLF